MQKKQYDLALADFDKALLLNPNSEQALRGRIFVLSTRNKLADASANIDKGLSLAPNDRFFLDEKVSLLATEKKFPEALDTLGKIDGADSDLHLRLKRAALYFGAKQYSKAIQDYDYYIIRKSDNADAFNRRGSCYLALSDYQRAIDDAETALHLEPGSPNAYQIEAKAYLGMSRIQTALSVCNRGLAGERKDPELMWTRSFMLMRLGKFEEALKDLEALKLEPGSDAKPDFWYYKAYCSLKIGQVDDCLSDCDKCLKFGDNNALAHALKGKAYLEKKSLEKAKQELDTAIQQHDRVPEFYFDRGQCLAEQGNYKAARDNYLRCRDLGGRIGNALNELDAREAAARKPTKN